MMHMDGAGEVLPTSEKLFWSVSRFIHVYLCKSPNYLVLMQLYRWRKIALQNSGFTIIFHNYKIFMSFGYFFSCFSQMICVGHRAGWTWQALKRF